MQLQDQYFNFTQKQTHQNIFSTKVVFNTGFPWNNKKVGYNEQSSSFGHTVVSQKLLGKEPNLPVSQTKRQSAA